MAWTTEKVELLKRLWTQGVPTGDIGKELDVTKNAVVGKAHRLGLESRPSPIKRAGAKQATKTSVKKAKESKVSVEEKAKDSLKKEAKKSISKTSEKKEVKKSSEPSSKKSGKAKKEEVKLCTVSDLTSRTCRWPIGDPKDKDFHFCGKQTVADKPYCEEHILEAYVSAKSLR